MILVNFQVIKLSHRSPSHFCKLTMRNHKEKLNKQSNSPMQQNQ